MKKKSKKRILSLSLVLAFMVGMMVNFPINANATTYSGANILLGSTYNQLLNVILDNTGQSIYASEYGGGNITKMDKVTGSSTLIKSGLSQPIGMALDSNDDLYVALHSGSKVIKIDHSTGTVSDVATGVGLLTGIVLDSSKEHIYVAQYGTGKIIKMDKNGSNKSDFATGLGNNSIIGMTIDSSDNLYVSDRLNNSVKKIDTSGNVTTFATGLSGITWVTRDSYGYFYASASSSRLIKKLDTNGNVIASFSTENYSPWGAAVDSSGYIFFTSISSDLIKIIGKGNTVGENQIVLEMNNELVGTAADPSAFTLHGIASNPTVTSAEVSGKNVTLTLSSPISGTDTSIKVDYTKSGTNNLTGDMIIGSDMHVQLDSFAGLPVKNNIVSVVSVFPISNKNVAYRTTQGELSLPTKVNVGLSNSVTTSVAVTWNNGTPAYNGNTAGTYSFTGILTLPGGVLNPNNYTASINVIVQPGDETPPPEITVEGVNPLDDITVSNGTVKNNIGLLETIDVRLSNGTTTSAAVTWDNGSPAYNGGVAGTYTFTGALTLPDGVTNPSSYIASVRVIVQAANNTPPPVVDNNSNSPSSSIINTISSSSSSSSNSSSSTEEITVKVTAGNEDKSISKTILKRITASDGTKKDTVTYTADKAKETITELLSQRKEIARIVATDNDPLVSETKVNIPRDTLLALSRGNINLEIETNGVRLSLSKASIQDLSKNGQLAGDLYFRVVPIKDEVKQQEIKTTANKEMVIKAVSGKDGAQVLGIPMTIETNMTGRNVDIVLPLKGVTIPTDPAEKEAFLKDLGVFIEHSDGEKVLEKGEIVEYEPGVYGIKFTVNKFSDFTIVKLNQDKVAEGWKNDAQGWKYIKNGQPATGWNQINSVWYLMDSTGIMQTGWKQENGEWYYLNASGAMSTGWVQSNGIWYLLKDNGAMATGWKQENGEWYYLYSSGAMASDAVVDGYTLGTSGAWIQ